MFTFLMGLSSVTPKQLHEMTQHGDVAVFDMNARQSWLKARVPGAKNLDPLNFGRQDLPAEKTSRLVFYCSNPFCRKAPNAARQAKKMGYPDVYVMTAGITGWIDAKLPAESGE